MSNYTQEQQTEIVKDAMTLTTAIQIGEEELQKQKAENFKSKPEAPFHKKLEVPQIEVQIPPEPKTNYSFVDYLKNNILYILISLVCWPCLIYAYFQYSKKKKEIEEQLKQAPDYQKAIYEAKRVAEERQQKVKEDIAKQQADIDTKYQSELEHYNNVILPEYNKELEAWEITQKIKITMLEEELQLNKDTLKALYDSSRLISLSYRSLGILCWIYDDMRSSDHDIRYATELLDRDRQRIVTEQSGRMVKEAVEDMHSSMMDGFHAVYDAIDEGNEILAKTRRDQNLANTAGIIQRHNLNKMVKAQNGMLDKFFNQ